MLSKSQSSCSFREHSKWSWALWKRWAQGQQAMEIPLWLHKEWSLRWNVTSPVDITLVCILKCFLLLLPSPLFLLTFFHFLSHVLFAALFHLLHFSTLLSWLIIARDKGPHETWYKHKGALILLLVTQVWIYSSSHEDSFHTSDSLGDNVASNWNNEGFGPVAVWTELHNLAYFIFYSSFSLCMCVLILPIWFCFTCLWVLFSRRVLLHLSSFPIFHENYQAKDQKLFCEKQIV